MPKKITAQQLRNLGACKEQVDKFTGLFGGSVTVTIKLCVEHAQDFCWVWASSKLLGAAALAEYDKARAAAFAEYGKADEAAYAEYSKACSVSRAKYDKADEAAYAKYDKACSVSWTKYHKVCAAAFARAYKKMSP